MFRKLFGPKHTFADAVRLLEAGLRNGEITLRNEPAAPPLPPNHTDPSPDRNGVATIELLPHHLDKPGNSPNSAS